MADYPNRIVCLTEETTETLYLLGCGERVVGISGFTMRPPEARATTPKVSTFLDADFDRIVALKPDVVFAFSDLQAGIAGELIRRGLQVVTFNQRSVEEILQTILVVGGIVGKREEAEQLVASYEERLHDVRSQAGRRRRPKVFFEEWDDPLISGIRWVSELIEAAGGEEIFPELRAHHAAKQRIVDPEEVVRRNPEIIIGSWCGKQFKPERVRGRIGWESIAAVRDDRLHEIKSTIILQPGPAALTDGLDELVRIIHS
jgi:iron complex transport system substrate-binding protein